MARGDHTFLSALPFFGVVLLVAASGSAFQPGDWYAGLEKPVWTPPNVVFPIVWPVLYVIIAWAGWRFWRAGAGPWVLAAWGLQLVLNGAWSWLFFGLHEMALAFFDIRLLWLCILATMALGWRVDRTASLSLTPYLAWVGFASWLNFSIWMLNPDASG